MLAPMERADAFGQEAEAQQGSPKAELLMICMSW
jgi:hypothetical protein